MIFALGFLVALLLVLLFLPAFWSRAIRLSIRKIGERLPMSMAEVAAERDGLRAESAIRQRRLEQARDRAFEARDIERANVGRLTAQVAAHEMELEVLRLDATTHEKALIETKYALLSAEAELGTMRKDHYDAGVLVERAARNAEAMGYEQQRLRDVADQRRLTIASLETRIQGMQARIDDLEASVRDAERTLAFGAIDTLPIGAESADVERLLTTLAERDETIHASTIRHVELEHRVNLLDAEKTVLQRDLAAARSANGTEAADRDEIALLRKSIAEVAAEVVRLGGLRENAADAPNVLQIRRSSGRDGHAKSLASDPLQAGHGKSVGAT